MKNENHCFGLSIYCKMSAVYLPRSVTILIISQVPFVSMACNLTGWYIVYIDNVSLIKNVSVFEILELTS